MTDLQHSTAALAQGESTIQNIPRSFYITGIVWLDDGTKKNVDLGKHEASTCNADPELLIAMPEFADFVHERVRYKCPGGYLDGVFISLGKKQLKTLFWNLGQRGM